MKEDDKPNGMWTFILMIGILLFIGLCLINSATDGIFFAEDLECPEGEWKMVAVDYVPHGDEWKIQPDGTYAHCAVMNFTENENETEETHNIVFSVDGEKIPYDPDDWSCYDINNNEITCSDPISQNTAMVLIK